MFYFIDWFYFSEEEVTKFVGRVIRTAHGDVVDDLTPSKSGKNAFCWYLFLHNVTFRNNTQLIK